ncbi:quinon protein alcohol dehydrogenase-like superfamily [Mycena crocata]|nr:quinon protein alcohol dehydrogenase-like superfamily [Mycena crocata]
MSTYSLLKTLTPPQPGKAGAINALLFFENGTMLASGGDDQVLRIWDVSSGDCLQELTNPLWGQITNLSLLDALPTRPAVVFRFNKQSGTINSVFTLDDAVECQALDSLNSKFAVGSAAGRIRLYTIKNRNVLVPVWNVETPSSSRPRSLSFLGDSNEQLLVHTLNPGPVFCLDLQNGKLSSQLENLKSGAGFVAISSNRRMKAIFDVSSDAFELYTPNSTTPALLTVSANSGRLKGAAFAEEDETLVCGGDDGYLHVFNLVRGVEPYELTHTEDCSPVYALDAHTTEDCHLIASGGSEIPATIYLWSKPTEYKLAEARRILMEAEEAMAIASKRAEAQTKADAEAKASKDAQDARHAEIAQLTAAIELSHLWGAYTILFILLCAFALSFWCVFHLIDQLKILTPPSSRVPV